MSDEPISGKPSFARIAIDSEIFDRMTLRDYFAAAAMQGMLAAGEGYSTTELCEYAYDVADEMLSRRDAK
jgi:hypothetical protein